MRIRLEVLPLIGMVAVLSACVWPVSVILSAFLFATGTACLLFFFRDPERVPPRDSDAILAGADGRVMSVTCLWEPTYLRAESVRISIFLSLFDVHVNRAPMTGYSYFLGHFPGRRFFAFLEKSSELNQHNMILIEGPRTRCLVAQIVGPVARRVVYWLSKTDKETISVHLGPAWYMDNQDVQIAVGDKVEVKGSRVTLDGKPTLIAAEVKKGDEVLTLRDANGFPAWSGWRRR